MSDIDLLEKSFRDNKDLFVQAEYLILTNCENYNKNDWTQYLDGIKKIKSVLSITKFTLITENIVTIGEFDFFYSKVEKLQKLIRRNLAAFN